jgi:hypothetical protein
VPYCRLICVYWRGVGKIVTFSLRRDNSCHTNYEVIVNPAPPTWCLDSGARHFSRTFPFLLADNSIERLTGKLNKLRTQRNEVKPVVLQPTIFHKASHRASAITKHNFCLTNIQSLPGVRRHLDCSMPWANSVQTNNLQLADKYLLESDAVYLDTYRSFGKTCYLYRHLVMETLPKTSMIWVFRRDADEICVYSGILRSVEW